MPALPAAESMPTVSVTLERLVVRSGVRRADHQDHSAMEHGMGFFYVFCSFVPLAVFGMLLEAAVFVVSAVLQVGMGRRQRNSREWGGGGEAMGKLWSTNLSLPSAAASYRAHYHYYCTPAINTVQVSPMLLV
ncbi:hypothetical protein E2C01_058330 [Portunus trituberculatus]|uniref:Uncharacterized protein n=1 Tax=Portunus trituberculatus TaxID=210409 RepID=A0A5B7H2P1_PORTR|nr:hypothetical protein [Portunus trituberculatus]